MESSLLIFTLAGLITGMSKFSVGGMGMLVLPILMIAYPGPEVLGVLIPMYLWSDLAVMCFYRRRIHWRLIGRMAPLLALGMAMGGWLLKGLDVQQFQLMIGGTILAMLGLSLWLERRDAAFIRHPLAAQGVGGLVGLVSVTTNTAGPLVSVYLMEQKLDKATYLSTRAWLFTLVNMAKIPLVVSLGFMTLDTTLTSLQALPGLAIGSLIGVWLVGKLRMEQFKWLIRAVATVAAIKLFAF